MAAVRQLNRLELVGETMRQALNELAVVAPKWVRAVVLPEWFSRYAQRFDNLRLPRERSERERLLEQIGADGIQLLSAVSTTDAPLRDQFRQLAGVEMLRRIWVQQFWTDNRADGSSQIRLRADDSQPPGEQRIHSPFDEDARYSAKRLKTWVGYKSHLTETCEDDEVHLITHVETTSAVVQDVSMPETIHAALAAKDLLPSVHFLDAGYVTGDLLVEAKRDLEIDVCGPVKKDVRWQANTGQSIGLADFKINWATQTVTCPNSQTTSAWYEQTKAGDKPMIQVKSKPFVCRAGADQAKCTRSARGARNLVLQPQAQPQALQQGRQEQETAAFRQNYAKRSGNEGTNSQAVRACEMRQARYRGLAKTHLQMISTAVAINLHRLLDWWTGVPRSLTRRPPFARLAPETARISTTWRA